MRQKFTTAGHWGAFHAVVEDGRLVDVEPYEHDPDPSSITRGLLGAVDGPSRLRWPMVRESVLAHGLGANRHKRGAEPFKRVSWDTALDLAAEALGRAYADGGPESVYGGSYGWSSAGRFHHAQSQLHRFLNMAGGCVRSRDNYSFAAALVVAPHIAGPFRRLWRDLTPFRAMRGNTDLVVAFGGLRAATAEIGNGGVGRHLFRPHLLEAARSGTRFVNVSPLRDDIMAEAGAEWAAPRPNTDTAVMLGLAHTLLAESLHDQAFLERYTQGFETFRRYLTGASDGTPKSADWAAAVSGLDAEWIRALARRMASGRTIVSCAVALQRADHGEQPIWMTVALAAMLGQIGKPGGGFGLGYGADAYGGAPMHDISWPALPQGKPPIDRFIPVARVSDMLLNPGAPFDYDGKRYDYPDIRVVSWCGGNPFHHHQDLGRLAEAFRRPETVIVNEQYATATARFSDIVFPATTTLEREDIAMVAADRTLVAMRKAMAPIGEARDDYDTFAALSRRLGRAEAFTEGRDAEAWLRLMWEQAREVAAARRLQLPSLAEFREIGFIELPEPEDRAPLTGFIADPSAAPLSTPSGRIEIFSERVAGFGYADCPGHPAWLPPYEWLGAEAASRFPLHLISNQPTARLHSQLDDGETSRRDKIDGRAPLSMHPEDAAARGLAEGDLARVHNDRGACLAAVRLTSGIRRGVAALSTGAWLDPLDPEHPSVLCRHGNPNVLTRDAGCSRLSQGPSPMSCLVQVSAWDGPAPEPAPHRPLDAA